MPTIPTPTYVCFGIAVLAILIALLYGLAPQRRVSKYTSTDAPDYGPSDESDEEAASEPDQNPLRPRPLKASVIVYIESRKFSLEDFIAMMLTQDYPDYEIIAINDANAEATAMVAEKFADNERVYITFIPQGSHNLSRRKLALTIGMKAAKGEVVVTTSTNVSIPSDTWLSELMAPFNEDPDKDIALGYTRMDFTELRGSSAGTGSLTMS